MLKYRPFLLWNYILLLIQMCGIIWGWVRITVIPIYRNISVFYYTTNVYAIYFAPGCHVSSNRDRKAMVCVRQILIFSPHPFGGTRHSKQTLPQNLATWSLSSQCIWVPGWGPGPVHTWIKKIKIFFQRREAFLTASVNSAVCFQCEPVFQPRFPQGGPADLHAPHCRSVSVFNWRIRV